MEDRVSHSPDSLNLMHPAENKLTWLTQVNVRNGDGERRRGSPSVRSAEKYLNDNQVDGHMERTATALAGTTSAATDSQAAEPAFSLPDPEEGFRLMRAFLRIRDAARRQTIVEFVADMARLDEAGDTR